MIRRDPSYDSDVEALLERGRIIVPVPDVVRARSLARARAIMGVAVALPPKPMLAWWRRGLPLAAAASVALVVSTASALVAFRIRAVKDPAPPAPPMSPASAASAPIPMLVQLPPVAVDPLPSPAAHPQRLVRQVPSLESYAAELDLLQRTQVAYAGHDFSGALALVAEHGRRFPNGRLAEEREALRIRSLVAAGRTAEANRAAASFADRFPRSAMLPRLGTEP